MAEVRDQGLVSHLALPSHHPWTNIDQGPLCAVRNKTTPSVLRTFYSPALLVGWVKGKQRRITLAEPSTILANICKPGQVFWPSAPLTPLVAELFASPGDSVRAQGGDWGQNPKVSELRSKHTEAK